MKIRAGYEISYECSQPTPMLLMLSVHPSRIPDLLTPDRMRIDPAIPTNEYRDGFGNTCHVIHAPACRLTLSADFLIQDSGATDDVALDAEMHPLEKLPVGDSGLSARKPLLRDRSLHHDRVVRVRQNPKGMEAGASDLRLRL